MRDSSPVDAGTEYESSSSEYENGLEVLPTSSDDDDAGYRVSDSSSSSKEDEPSYVRRRLRDSKKHVKIHGGPIILKPHHLGDSTDLNVRKTMGKGETLELDDGIFLRITSFGRLENSQAVRILVHLLRPMEEFQDSLPVTFGGREMVSLREARKHDPKPEGHPRSTTSNNVLRIRHLIIPTSASASEYVPHSDTGAFTDSVFLFCQWTLEAELSDFHVTRAKRSSRSIQKGAQRKPKAFLALACQEPLVGDIIGIDDSHYQHQIYNDLFKAGSGKGLRQLKKYGHVRRKNIGKGKDYCKDAQGSRLITRRNDGKRIGRFARASARRTSSHHLELAYIDKSPSPSRKLLEQDRVPQAYTIAEGASGQCSATTYR